MAMSNGSAAPSNGGQSKPLVFVSYSHKDAEWKNRVTVHLKALELDEQIELWDDSRIDVGGKWRDDIVRALNRAGVAILLVSRDFLASEFIIRQEVKHFLEQAARGRLPILPLLINKCTWKVIRWVRELQMLPGEGKTIEDHYADSYDDVFIDLAEAVSEIVNDPKFAPPEVVEEEVPQIAARSTVAVSGQGNLTVQITGSDNTIILGDHHRGIAEKQPVVEPLAPELPPVSEECVDIDRLPVTGAELFGRDRELALLDEAWVSEAINVVSLVAWGGVGKSTLVNKWLEGVEADNWRGAQRVLGWSFFSQGTGERITSADQFIDYALRFFDDPEPEAGSPWAKGERLADLVRQNRAFLILDGLEPLQDRYQGVKDPALQRLIEELARDNTGLCVITTREAVKELEDFSASTIAQDLEQISPEAGRALLRVKGVRGTDAELEKASAAFGNHALAINLLASWLRAIPGHPIAAASAIPERLDLPESSRHPRRVMAAFAQRFGEDSAEVEVLRLLGLFDRPASKGALDAVRATPAIPGLTNHLSGLDETGWLRLLERLREFGLVASKSTHAPDDVDAHPLVREHFGQELRQNHPGAWRAGHERLYEHFKELPVKHQPDTLEEMAPLFQAVFHGCQSGRHQEALDEVYWARICRHDRAYLVRDLGAFGADLAALAGFFDPHWERPVASVTEADQAFVVGQAGFGLRALGRLKEAAQLMRVSLDMAVEQEDWLNAPVRGCNLSELQLTLGEVNEAIAVADKSVNYAHRCNDPMWRIHAPARLASALHHKGEWPRAEALFRKAERLQANQDADHPRLYSYSGFQYCDLLLDLGRHAEVRERAAQTLEWSREADLGPLTIALSHLSLGRAELLAHEAGGSGDLAEAEIQNNQAVHGLRRAGTIHNLPWGLLARAMHFRITEQFDRARRDLHEALLIAARSGMRLHECDGHLDYARLELAQGNPDAARTHLTRAEELVAATGYHRRDRDIEELKATLG